MRCKIKAVVLVVILAVALAGCQTPSGYYDPQASAAGGMAGGMVTGAALGALIGAAAGNPAAGAWIGAASGAGVGALVGSAYARDQNMARAQTPPGPLPQGQPPQGPPPQGYDPGMGNAVAIDQAQVAPDRIQPGGQVMLTMNYHVMTPQNAVVPLTLVREIRKDGQMLAPPYEEPRQVRNGSYEARVGYNLPPNAPPGGYVATFRVISGLGTTEKSVYFSVQ